MGGHYSSCTAKKSVDPCHRNLCSSHYWGYARALKEPVDEVIGYRISEHLSSVLLVGQIISIGRLHATAK